MARLLIVEDDVSLRENLVRMLQLKGHECLCCESFTNAAAEVLSASPDCILLDLSLPGAYGHEICRAVRQESGSADSARRQLERDGVLLDPVRAEVSYRGKSVELARNELLILHVLMENAGSIISRSELMDELWQTDAFVDDNTLTVNVNRLRRSLQSIDVPDDFITTRRGVGYVVK